MTVTNEGVSRLTRLAAFHRPINNALFGMLTREGFRMLAQLLARLAANGDCAVKFAEHIEATRELEHHHAAMSSTKGPERRSKQSGARRAKQ